MKRTVLKQGALLTALLVALSSFQFAAFGDEGADDPVVPASETVEAAPAADENAAATEQNGEAAESNEPAPAEEEEELWRGYVRFYFVEPDGTPLTQDDFSAGTLKHQTDNQYTEAGPNNWPTSESTIPLRELNFLKDLQREKDGQRLAGWYVEYLGENNELIERYRGMRGYFNLESDWTLQHDQQAYRFVADYLDASLFSKRNITVDLQGGVSTDSSIELNRQTIKEYAQGQTVFGDEFVYLDGVEVTKEGANFLNWDLQLLNDQGQVHVNKYGMSSFYVWTDTFEEYSWTLLEAGERHFQFVAVWDKNDVTVIDGTGSAINLAKNTEVTIVANEAPAGYYFSGWAVEKGKVTLADAMAKETTFKMPQAEVRIRATYTRIPTTSSGGSSYSSVRPDAAKAPETVINNNATPKSDAPVALETKFVINSTQFVQDGKSLTMDAAPFIQEGRTMLPLRYLAQALGLKVEWDASSKTAKLVSENKEIVVPINSLVMNVNGQEVQSDVLPLLKNGRVYLSISNIAKALGLEVGTNLVWNEETKEVLVKLG